MTFQVLFAIVAVGALIGWLLWEQRRKNGGDKTGSSFTTDLTEAARQGKLEPVVGMDEVVERVLHVIARKQKNNPLLIGEPGVGKTAVVEGLAQRIASGNVPEAFRGKRILSMRLTDMMSGTKYRGELESRLQRLLAELEKDPRKNILFIDEIHMIEQARGTEGSLDIADILKPALSRGALQIIGATTWREYEQYLRPDAAVERRFQPVLVEEPSRAQAIEILNGVKADYEKFHDVCIPDETVTAAVDASMKFVKDRFLPDKAFDVIDEACAKVSLESARTEHAAPLGVLHQAAGNVKAACAEGEPVVKPSDVEEVAQQWHAHRTRPAA